MKKIYRIETETGVGMYANLRVAIFMNVPKVHITPKEDRKLWEALSSYADSDEQEDIEMMLQDFKFGFADIVQLKQWVYEDNWIRRMHEMDLRLVEYDCEDWDVLEGDCQVVFKNPTKSRMSFLNYIC